MSETAVHAPAVATTRVELDAALARVEGDVVLVPTMGALHEGHASLIRQARVRAGSAGAVVVSVFVNPLQFGPGEDFERYPRTADADVATAGQEGADVVFAPAVEEIYPDGVPTDEATDRVTLDPGSLADELEGAIRPGHFRGVLTVVAKLFGLVRPDAAVFGEKDYQQLVLIRRMVTDLCLSGRRGPLEIIGAPTVREGDGLALSSRNRYLDDEQRYQASALSRILYAARTDAEYGPGAALTAARNELHTAAGLDLDYLEIRAADLTELPADVPPGTGARALIAARVGGTRLIDNVALTLGVPATGGDD